MHQGSRLPQATCGFSAGVEHQIDRQVRLGYCSPEFRKQGKAVLPCKPGIWSRDQQVDI